MGFLASAVHPVSLQYGPAYQATGRFSICTSPCPKNGVEIQGEKEATEWRGGSCLSKSNKMFRSWRLEVRSNKLTIHFQKLKSSFEKQRSWGWTMHVSAGAHQSAVPWDPVSFQSKTLMLTLDDWFGRSTVWGRDLINHGLHDWN